MYFVFLHNDFVNNWSLCMYIYIASKKWPIYMTLMGNVEMHVFVTLYEIHSLQLISMKLPYVIATTTY